MNRTQTFKEFLSTQSVQIPLFDFLINLVIVAVLAFLLNRLYIHYGSSMSNRRAFARNFVPIGMTTMLIISIVKSSLALSLGLVGALSIVRFRAAIKEPEELTYLFITIALGLGLGADQRLTTISAFILIAAILILRHFLRKTPEQQNLHISVSGNPAKLGLEQIIAVLKKYCSQVELKRFDQAGENLEASFLVEFGGFDQLNNARSELQSIQESIKVTFLDNRAIV